MRIENSFVVPAEPEQAWDLLMDVPRVIPCMPGARLAETVDGDHWKAEMAVKLGPISLTFATDVAREEADVEGRRAVLSANAREVRGRGSARATIESTLAAEDGGTRVDIVTELSLTGPAAQYGRGVVQSVAGQLTQSFASCLQAQLEPAPEPEPEPTEAAASGNGAAAAPPPAQPQPPERPAPVSGLRLIANALRDLLFRH